MPLRARVLCAAALLLAAIVGPSPAAGEPHTHPRQRPVVALPGLAQSSVVQVYVQGERRAPVRLAVPGISGPTNVANAVLEIAARDYLQSSLFEVVDPAAYSAINVSAEGIGTIDERKWRACNVEAIVKGEVSLHGSRVHLDLRLFTMPRAAAPATVGIAPSVRREYDVAASEIRRAVHDFDDEVVRAITGVPGNFGTRLVFSATVGPNQKGIFSIDSDGQGLARLPSPPEVAIEPAVGPGGAVWYAGQLKTGTSYGLFKVGAPGPQLAQLGNTFGVAFSRDGMKMAVVVSSGTTSDIWVGAPDGSGMHRAVTGALNMHPTFGPHGELVYVSTHAGNPQIYVDGRRVTTRGSFNMAPSWCADPEGDKIVFMGRDGSTWDIFTVDPDGSSQSMRRLTQDQGSNTYPACSPDGRTIAFFSTRGGLFTMSSRGMNQLKITDGVGESLRWEGN